MQRRHAFEEMRLGRGLLMGASLAAVLGGLGALAGKGLRRLQRQPGPA